MQVTLIHNPTAGDGIASADDLRSMLREAGYHVRVASTKKKWRTALKAPADLVVAAGGDGTARRVALQMAGTGIPIAILPFGTANNIGKTLGSVGPARGIIEAWRHAEPRPLDLGVAHLDGTQRRFVESAGGGLFADLIRIGPAAVEKKPVFVGRETDRMMLLLRAAVRDASARDWDVEIDGVDRSGTYLGIEVLNVRFGGPNVPLAPAADTGDGRLEVVLFDEAARRELMRYAQRRLHMGSAELPSLPLVQASRITIRPPHGTSLHADDKLLECDEDGRFEITVDAGALRVIGQPSDDGGQLDELG